MDRAHLPAGVRSCRQVFRFAGQQPRHDRSQTRRGGAAGVREYGVFLSDAISLVGRDYVYKTANDTYLCRTGLARDRIVGRPVAEVMGQTVFDEIVKPRLDRSLAGETVTYAEWFDFRAQGRRYVEVTCYTLPQPRLRGDRCRGRRPRRDGAQGGGGGDSEKRGRAEQDPAAGRGRRLGVGRRNTIPCSGRRRPIASTIWCRVN